METNDWREHIFFNFESIGWVKTGSNFFQEDKKEYSEEAARQKADYEMAMEEYR